MSHQPAWYTRKALDQWAAGVTAAFPELSKTQAVGLATWSFGMVRARSGARSAVAFFLAQLLRRKYGSVRQRLREFYQEATAQKGGHRRELDVTACFGPLRRWVLRDGPGRQRAVARDASTRGRRFTVRCVRVVDRGGAIPIAWKIVPATAKGSWKEPWLALLEPFQGLVPTGFSVVVRADRGRYAT